MKGAIDPLDDYLLADARAMPGGSDMLGTWGEAHWLVAVVAGCRM